MTSGGSSARPGAARGARTATRRWWPLAALAAATGLAFAFGLHRYLSLDRIIEQRDVLTSFVMDHWVAALGAYMAVYIAVIALSLPGGLVLTVLGGSLFGWAAGGAAALVSATLGACAVFLIARTSLAGPLAERAGPWLERLQQGFREDAVSYMLFLRLVPAFPFWLVNLAPSLLGVPFKTYAFTTLVGILPGTIAFAVAGAGLDSLVVGQRREHDICVATGRLDCRTSLDAGALLTPELIAAFVLLGIVALLPVAVRRLSRRKFGT